jgi:hypothetical protein
MFIKCVWEVMSHSHFLNKTSKIKILTQKNYLKLITEFVFHNGCSLKNGTIFIINLFVNGKYREIILYVFF